MLQIDSRGILGLIGLCFTLHPYCIFNACLDVVFLYIAVLKIAELYTDEISKNRL